VTLETHSKNRTMSKKQSPVPAPTYNGRPLVVRGEVYPEPKWDLYIAALLAFSLRDVQKPQDQDGHDD
jgi:hypothetical protein